MSGNRVLVTGANGNLGRRLISRLRHDRSAGENNIEVVAAVRSQRAAEQVAAAPGGADVDVRIVDYTSEKSLEEAAQECDAAVHLVGIIKETRDARYADAHERTCEALALAAAAAAVDRIVYLSIFGSRKNSANTCLASKGRAEELLLAGAVSACVLRVPMVLGPDDYASHSLRTQAQAGVLPLLGGGRTLQQPIDAEDVVSAIAAALTLEVPIRAALDLGGPECLSHRDLIQRAALLYDSRPTVMPVPLALVRAGVALLERFASSPPMTTAMLDVLQHDDQVDTREALARLGLSLTPLDETLTRYVGPEPNSSS